jgi:hypothetical protein
MKTPLDGRREQWPPLEPPPRPRATIGWTRSVAVRSCRAAQGGFMGESTAVPCPFAATPESPRSRRLLYVRFVYLLVQVHITNCFYILLFFNPFTAEVAIMRLLGSAPKSHLCDQKRRSKVTGLSDLMTLFIDLGCLYCKQTQRAFNVFNYTLNWWKIDSVDQKFN